jgi:hypothetical protein
VVQHLVARGFGPPGSSTPDPFIVGLPEHRCHSRRRLTRLGQTQSFLKGEGFELFNFWRAELILGKAGL